MRARLAALVSLIAAASVFPQQQPPLVETIEVRVANIDVVVRDKAGNPIAGLTRDDFVLLDDGVPQKITNFYEVRRGEDPTAPAGSDAEVPVEVRQRRIVVFVDSASLTPARKKSVLESLDRFLARLRPEDQCMLVSWRFQPEIITPFTNNRPALQRGIDVIARNGAAGERSAETISTIRRNIQGQINQAEEGFLTWAEAYDNARLLVNRYGERLLVEERAFADALDIVTTTMAGLQGKKVLVLVAEQLPRSPASDLYAYINEEIGTHLQAQTVWFETATGVVGNDVPVHFERVAQMASERGVTVYPIGAAAVDNDISSEDRLRVDHTYTFTRDANTASALQGIADVTGGVAITRSSNFDLAFDTIDRDLSSYYSLGYKPAGEGGHRHNIVVKSTNSAYAVRARQAYVVQSTDDLMADRVVANLYVEPGKNDWPIALRTAAPRKDGKHFLVPVEVEIPSTLTLIPQQDKLAGSFVLYFALGDAKGKTSTVLRRPEDLLIPVASEKTVRAKPMRFTTSMRMKPGENVLSVAILDQLSGSMGFARTKILAH